MIYCIVPKDEVVYINIYFALVLIIIAVKTYIDNELKNVDVERFTVI